MTSLCYFDTHAHFPLDEGKIRETLRRAADAGVSRIMAVGGSEELNSAAALARTIAPEQVCLALGWDRDQTGRDLPELDYSGVSAVGEIGLDFHYTPETAKAQCELFAEQLALADRLGLPVVIHTRDADDATLGVLAEVPWRHDSSRGIIHSFTGTRPFARKLLDMGFHVSISGIVTFRLADNVREVATYIPDDRILIETDSPFLAPVPKRGKENEPAFVAHTCEFLAKLRNTSTEAFAALTFRNAEKLLG